MPSRLRRHQSLGHHHFITFSCHGRLPYLLSREAKTIFLEELEVVRLTYQFAVAGFVIMPEHVHLLLTEPVVKPLATVLGILKRSVSHRLAEKPFWLSRYYDFNVSSNEKLIEKLRYMHRNPVVRGLVEAPEEYVWSSFRFYGFHEVGVVTVTRSG